MPNDSPKQVPDADQRTTDPHRGTSTPAHRLAVRCDQCDQLVELEVDADLGDIGCPACGARFRLTDDSTEAREAIAVKELGHFRLIERLGVGGYGTVWKAYDAKLDRTVAVKIPRRETPDAEQQEKFLREARSAGQLRHPNIVSVHEVGRAGDTIYIVNDFIRGASLSEFLRERRLDFREVAQMAIKIANALEHAHQHGVIHRDLKPQNVMIDEAGQPHLMDFGLAKREAGEQTITVDGTVLGTPAYMSPEQASGQSHSTDRRSDVYSLGVLLFEMVTGRLPFSGTAPIVVHKVINDEPPRPRRFDRRIPLDLETICLKCLAKSPDGRYSTAQDVADELGRWLDGEPIHARPIPGWLRAAKQARRRPWRSLLLFVTLVATISIALVSSHYRRARIAEQTTRWVHEQAIPEITKLAETGQYYAAHRLAADADKRAPNELALVRLRPLYSTTVRIVSESSGVAIYLQPVGDSEFAEVFVGETPLDAARLPFGLVHFRVEKPGFARQVLLRKVTRSHEQLNFQLEPVNGAHPGMVRIPQRRHRVSVGETTSLELPEFWVDQTEVTNREYRQFITAGGYDDPSYWQQPIIDNGEEIDFAKAMARFVDQSGQQGPATWKNGTYPAGDAEHPVNGVSWFEAAAFARFAGKSLPTVYHWRAAAGLAMPGVDNAASYSHIQVPTGPAAAGGLDTVNGYGLFDVIGNVREWCSNLADSERHWRYALGGAWTDPRYMHIHMTEFSPWSRDDGFGFRCVEYAQSSDTLSAELTGQVSPSPQSPYAPPEPISNEEFAVYRDELYSYPEQMPHNASINVQKDPNPNLILEKVELDAVYDGERISALVLMPRNHPRPLQTVVYADGAGAALSNDELSSLGHYLRFIAVNGRALVLPSLFGQHDRAVKPVRPRGQELRDLIIKRSKDFGRLLDYLETRDDFDTERIALLGFSDGAALAPVYLAFEPRFRGAVLLLGGLGFGQIAPRSCNPAAFAPRVDVPLLMINGRFDVIYDYQTNVAALHQLFGTPEGLKTQKVYSTGHGLIAAAPERLQEDVLTWLDGQFDGAK